LARTGAALSALACVVVALGGCSTSRMPGSGGSSQTYSPKVVADGEPVPKGGGTYHVGQPYTVNGQTYYPSENPRYREEGVASWYGPDFHGRLTANGEVFDMHSITAAHPTLPIPSYARVTNLENTRSIIVRINDRGPYTRGRIIDLSIGAAHALGFYGDGLARVRVEYVGRAPLEGTDDRMLLATLRQGSPAPAPSPMRLASMGSFVPGMPGDAGMPLPAERPYALGAAPGRIASRAAAGDFAAAPTSPARTAAMPTAATAAKSNAAPAGASNVAAYAPVRDDKALALMSGRGLY
jgi:rare lipoprotein A